MVLIFSMLGFAIAVLQDPVMSSSVRLPEAGFRFLLYGFLLCGILVVRIEERHTRSVAGLSALRRNCSPRP